MFKKSIFALGLVLSTTMAVADKAVEYEVTITNITPGQTFTPQLVVTHPGNIRLFTLGQPASEALEKLAESGDTGPLTDELANVAMDVQTIPGLLGPGMTTSTVITGHPRKGFISIAAMLIPTNDIFFALNRVKLPRSRQTIQHLVPGYDAGTEFNDQNCKNIPGPQCGGEGEGFSAEPGEGFVHIGNGFHELGDEDEDGNEILAPQTYDWRNPIAKITVKRIR